MNPGYKKYIPFQPQKIVGRTWPDKVITKAPTWCSVDLRDGNQALVDPMNLQEKLEYFHTLVDIGIKEIEIGFPSASETEYEIQSLTTDLEHYDDLIDYATVDLYLAEVLSLSQTPGETAGLGERMAAGLSASAAGLVQGVQDLLVWLSYHLFLVIVVLGAAGGGLFYWRRVRRGRKDGPPEERQP